MPPCVCCSDPLLCLSLMGGVPALPSPVLFPGGLKGCPGLGTLPPPTVRPWGRRPVPAALGSWGAGSAGVGARYHTHSARSCGLAFCAGGAARGPPEQGGPCPGVGHPGLGALPSPAACPCYRWPGTAARFPWARGVWARRLVTNPKARTLGSWLCALWRRHEGARGGGGGGAPLVLVWGVRNWALVHPQPPVFGACARGPLPTVCGCGEGRRGHSTPIPQRALLCAGFARCGGGTRASVGGRLLPGCGASGVGRSRTPNRPSMGRAAGARYPPAVGAGLWL